MRVKAIYRELIRTEHLKRVGIRQALTNIFRACTTHEAKSNIVLSYPISRQESTGSRAMSASIKYCFVTQLSIFKKVDIIYDSEEKHSKTVASRRQNHQIFRRERPKATAWLRIS